VLALLSLTSCATSSTPSDVTDKPRLAAVPAGLKVSCRSPVDLPEGDLDTVQTVTLWADDRAALGDCGLRHEALVEAVSALEAQGK